MVEMHGGSSALTHQKMSLDYIAPGNGVTVGSGGQRVTMRINPNAGWPTTTYQPYSEPNRQDSCQAGSLHSSPRSATVETDSSMATPSTAGSSDDNRTPVRKADRKRVDDRHNYDDEEKYAILYFRIERAQRWLDVTRSFSILFPVGRPRRRPGRTLTQHYVEREKGGLECRYYRLREDHGFKQLRSTEHDLADDRERLASLSSTLELSESFLSALRAM